MTDSTADLDFATDLWKAADGNRSHPDWGKTGSIEIVEVCGD